MMVILIIMLVLAALYLFLIAPSSERPDDSMLRGWLYAHRGLHDGNHKVPENSMEAFRLAVENGYGMELDVQLTKDKYLVVHHDGNLRRVCGVDRNIRDLTYEELCAIALPDGTRVPLLTEVLEMVNGRTPLIVEVKHYGSAAENAAAAWAVLQHYTGPYCVESFNPMAMQYFHKYAPQIVRGQLANGGKWEPEDLNLPSHLALKHLLVNAISRPHFVSYSVPHDHTLAMWLMRHVYKPYLAAWTIRSQKVLDDAQKKGYMYPIFERFTPAKK